MSTAVPSGAVTTVVTGFAPTARLMTCDACVDVTGSPFTASVLVTSLAVGVTVKLATT